MISWLNKKIWNWVFNIKEVNISDNNKEKKEFDRKECL